MHKPYRSTRHSVRIVSAAAALVTVLFLFDFVALLGDVGINPALEARAAQAAIRVA